MVSLLKRVKDYDVKLQTFFLALVALFPIYKLNYNSYTIALILFFGFLNTSLKKKYGFRELKFKFYKRKKVFLYGTLIFYPFFVSLLYSDNISYGLKSIQHLIPIIIFPFLFLFLLDDVSKKDMKIILSVFVAACFVQVVNLHFNFYILGLYSNLIEVQFYRLPFREAIMNFEYQPLHPTYVSIWYCFAICILINRLITIKIYSLYRVFIVLFIVFIIFLFIWTIIILSSRIAFLALVFVIGYSLFFIFNYKYKWLLSTMLIIITFLMIKNITFLSSRFINEFESTKFEAPIGKSHNSVNIRIGIYKCAVFLVSKNILFGYGIGDVQNELDECYKQFDTNAYIITSYNSHNYFLNSLLVAGLMAFLCLVIMFFYSFNLGIRNDCYIFVCFLGITFLGLCFENLLSRNHGVVFYSFFNALFIQFLIQYGNVNRVHSRL
ncbi:O-antigen ligase family protein [Galbibacter mesophilus]|uniref:O-antigen ligase family protein n=1 Tax=Galbibacter mesophilus TaxID=379069 RepID=UPI00191F1395|nr:O-antigen ligase family protein [Galbibacter mesophilus]MCM5663483.1 O-antigen ligase family protein [Galbibacter mesophilus]